jgi:hypothetical protein
MATSLGHLVTWELSLFGVTPGPYGGPNESLVVRGAHALAGAVVLLVLLGALAGMLRGAWRGGAGGDGRWRLDDLLVLGCLGDLGVFELLALSNNPAYTRYLTAGVVFATVLAGRQLGRLATGRGRGRTAHCAAVLAILLVVAFSAEVVSELRAPGPAQPVAALDAFLQRHHLSHGVGDYWAASVVTLETKGTVAVRPVVADLRGVLVRDGRQSDVAWYRGQRFQFLVYQRAPFGRVDLATITRTFGPPERTYTIGTYYVALWTHLLTLPSGAFP